MCSFDACRFHKAGVSPPAIIGAADPNRQGEKMINYIVSFHDGGSADYEYPGDDIDLVSFALDLKDQFSQTKMNAIKEIKIKWQSPE